MTRLTDPPRVPQLPPPCHRWKLPTMRRKDLDPQPTIYFRECICRCRCTTSRHPKREKEGQPGCDAFLVRLRRPVNSRPSACRSSHGRPVDVSTPACPPVKVSAVSETRGWHHGCGVAICTLPGTFDDACCGGDVSVHGDALVARAVVARLFEDHLRVQPLCASATAYVVATGISAQ